MEVFTYAFSILLTGVTTADELVNDINTSTAVEVYRGNIIYGMLPFANITDADYPYWCGVLLRIKNMDAFIKITGTTQAFTVDPQRFDDNEKMAEFNHFLLRIDSHNPKLLHGLYQHYSGSTSISEFFTFIRRKYGVLENSHYESPDNDLTPIEKARIKKQWQESLVNPILIMNTNNLDDFLNAIQSVSGFEFSVEHAQLRQLPRGYARLREFVERRTEKFVVRRESRMAGQLKQFLRSFVSSNNEIQYKITGLDSDDNYRHFDSLATSDKMIVERVNFNDIFANIHYTAETLAADLSSSRLVSHLIDLANTEARDVINS